MNTLKLLSIVLSVFAFIGCAAPTPVVNQKMEANIASVEPLPSTTLESRLNVKLRVRNPNDANVEYSGAFVELILQGKVVGTGVIDSRGTLPRYGETMLTIPVTVSALGDIQRARGLYGGPDRRLDYVLKGRLQGVGFEDQPFQWHGELAIPISR
jgi:LEA14-like dessication related protein